jgi:hypothetical protein
MPAPPQAAPSLRDMDLYEGMGLGPGPVEGPSCFDGLSLEAPLPRMLTLEWNYLPFWVVAGEANPTTRCFRARMLILDWNHLHLWIVAGRVNPT